MKTPKDTDPIRWRDLPPSRPGNDISDQTDGETEIGPAARLVGTHTPPDEFRLAQLRQRVLSRLDRGRLPLFRRAWFRTAALVLASLCVGGVATAITGRLIARHRLERAGPPVVPPKDSRAQTGRRSARRWRVAVNAPAQLDLVVDREGTEVAMVEGRAEISAPGASAATELAPGMSWRGAVPDSEPLSLAKVTNGPSLPNTPPASSVPASVPSRGPQPVVPRGSPPRPRTHHETTRTFAIAGASHGDKVAAPSPSPSTSDPTLAVPASTPTSLPGVSPPTFEAPAFDEAPFPTPTPHVSTPSSAASAPPRISEAALLGRALRHLRSDHDPKGALAQIDEHDRRFPEGTLKREAALARAEALLVLERKASALAVLDGLKLEGTAVDRRVELARAELRAARGRPIEAMHDFDDVLKSSVGDDFSGRALFGRAVLRANAGDIVGARDDLREYLRRADCPRRSEAERTLRRWGD